MTVRALLADPSDLQASGLQSDSDSGDCITVGLRSDSGGAADDGSSLIIRACIALARRRSSSRRRRHRGARWRFGNKDRRPWCVLRPAPAYLSRSAPRVNHSRAPRLTRARSLCSADRALDGAKLERAHSLCSSAGELGAARRGSEPGAGGDAGDGPAGLLAESGARGGRRTCARGGRSLRAPCRARRHAPAPSCGVRRRRARAGAPGAREAAPPGSGAVAAPSGGREARTVLHRGAGRCASAAAPSLAAPFSYPPRFTGCLDRLPVITGSGSGGSATRRQQGGLLTPGHRQAQKLPRTSDQGSKD